MMISFLQRKPLCCLFLVVTAALYVTLVALFYGSMFHEASHKVNGRQMLLKYESHRHSQTEHISEGLRIKPEGIVNETCENVVEKGFHQVSTGIYVYSAYLDSRLNGHDTKNGGIMWIRLIAIADTQHSLFCHFKTLGEIRYYSARTKYYELCENHNLRFGGFIISCQLPDKFHSNIPCSVTVSNETYLNKAVSPGTHAQLPLKLLKQDETTKKQGVCVPPLFGKITRSRIIEFVELSQLLGAEHFTFYDYGIQKEALDTLKFYQKKGIATILQWSLPHSVSTSQHIWYNGQSVSIQDCLYRNMGSFQHLAFNDVDEFIIPRVSGHVTWRDLVRDVEGDNGDEMAGYCFSSTFFYKLNQPQIYNLELITLKLMERSSLPSPVRKKCLVRPWRVFEMGIHHISKQNQEHWRPVAADPRLALVFHYRTCLEDFRMTCLSTSLDDTISRIYGDKLRGLYNKSLNAITKQ